VRSNTGYIAAFLIALLAMASCKKQKKAEDDFSDVKGSYFSIRQYGLDVWNTYSGEPFVIKKTVRINNGPIDSSLTNSDTIAWAPIFKAFFETDISDRKFLGKYNFTQYDDNDDWTHNFFYQAKADEDDLFTQKLLITMDQQTMKVKGIYVESIKKTFWSTVSQKLYYSPMNTIQIQTEEKPEWGGKKFTVVEYTFLR
jgi:hypothetical protein